MRVNNFGDGIKSSDQTEVGSGRLEILNNINSARISVHSEDLSWFEGFEIVSYFEENLLSLGVCGVLFRTFNTEDIGRGIIFLWFIAGVLNNELIQFI